MSLTGSPSYTERPDQPGINHLPDDVPAAAAAGELVVADLGCAACHTVDGTESIGPTWLGIWGEEIALEGGETVLVDAGYISTSILEPSA